jgi:hypothetical protein
MDDLAINEIARNDQYALGVLAEITKSILLANSELASYETRKQHIIDALLNLFRINYLLNSEYIQSEFFAAIILMEFTVDKYRIEINIIDLGIELINDMARQIYSELIARLILKNI